MNRAEFVNENEFLFCLLNSNFVEFSHNSIQNVDLEHSDRSTAIPVPRNTRKLWFNAVSIANG